MGDLYLINGAYLKCDKGTAPSQIKVTSNTSVEIQGQLVATENDKLPLVNIQPFGTCSVKGTCLPAPIAWMDTHSPVDILNVCSLTVKASCMCGVGGKITSLVSGQNPGSPSLFTLSQPESNNGTQAAAIALVATPEMLGTAAVVEETATSLSIAEWFMGATGVLAADDATGVGVADDVLIPFTLVIAGVAYLWYLGNKDDAPTYEAPPISVPIAIPMPPPSGVVETEPDAPPIAIPLPPGAIPGTGTAPIPLPPITLPISKPVAIPHTEAIPRDRTKEKDPCEPKELGYHRGGPPDTLHNQLADYYPPNIVKGTDWVVMKKAFDALSPTNILWEIKAWKYSTYSEWLKEVRITEARADIAYEWLIATECGYGYKMGVIDSNMKLELDKDPLIEGADIVEVIWFPGKPRPAWLP